MRLRELNKERTRETLVRVALELFAEQGYQATTLVDIATAAGVAPSTLHAYFPLKEDLPFSIYDAVIESAKAHLLDAERNQTGAEALSEWVAKELPAVVTRYTPDILVTQHQIVRTDPELEQQTRFRDALLEDVFAAALGRDLDPSDALRARVLGTIAWYAINDVWEVWTRQQVSGSDIAIAELTAATFDHVRKMLEGSMKAVESLPQREPIAYEAPRSGLRRKQALSPEARQSP
jgi:AcrR family transcriptional regulator